MSEEREFEIGRDEAWFANIKRTYDEYQQVSLDGQRRSQDHYDELKQLSVQALQNAVETANLVGKNTVETSNMVGKQAVRHSDLAIDRQWNVDEVAQLVARNQVFRDAIAAVVATSVADALSKSGT